MTINKNDRPVIETLAIIVAAVLIGATILFVLSGCSKSVADDRSDTAGGNQPDGWGDATYVWAYRNVDGVPTVVLFCIDKFRFAATLSSTGGDKPPSPALVRLPEQDAMCGKPQ